MLSFSHSGMASRCEHCSSQVFFSYTRSSSASSWPAKMHSRTHQSEGVSTPSGALQRCFVSSQSFTQQQRRTPLLHSRAARQPTSCRAAGSKASLHTSIVDERNGQPLSPRDILTVNTPEGSPIVPQQSTAASSKGSAVEEPDESRAFAVAMAKVAHDTKGSDILVLHVAPLIYWTSYMVFVTVYSRPQLGAVLGKMEKEAAEKWDRRLREGAQPSRTEWEVLDFADVVVHAFTAEQRGYFDLETFYGAAEEVELPFTTEAAEQPMSANIGWSQRI